jgi:hypothetical protein
VTRPDPRKTKNLLTRPDPTRPDPTRPDPTRPDPTRPDPTRPADEPDPRATLNGIHYGRAHRIRCLATLTANQYIVGNISCRGDRGERSILT